MGNWDQQFREHPIWAQMPSLGVAIDRTVKASSNDVEAIEAVERIRAILTAVGKRLSLASADLAFQPTLDQLNDCLLRATQELDAFSSDGNRDHIFTASSSAAAANQFIGQINFLVTSDELAALAKSTGVLRAATEESLSKLKETAVGVSSELTALKDRLESLASESTNERARLEQSTTSSINEMRQQANQAISNQQEQFSTAQEDRRRAAEQTLVERTGRLDRIAEDYTNKLADQNAEFTNRREEMFRDAEKRIEDLNATFAQKATAVLGEVDEQRKRVEKLVGVIGNLGVTSGYLRTANSAFKSMWFWQALTVVAMGVFVGVAYVIFQPVISHSGNQPAVDWQGVFARAFVSLTIGVFAKYCASQASRSFEVEKRNRRLALELEALQPFLASIPEDKRTEMILKVGDRSFGQEEKVQAADIRQEVSTSPVELLKPMAEFIAEVAKSLKTK